MNVVTKDKVVEGVYNMARVVGSTLGPNGNLVMIPSVEGVYSTKDGVTIAKHITSDDTSELMGIEMVRNASARVAKLVGDGTTSTIVLTARILENLSSSGINVPVNEEIRLYGLISELKNKAKEFDVENDLECILDVSLNGDMDKLSLLLNIYDNVGVSAKISVMDAASEKTSYRSFKGMPLKAIAASKYYIDPNGVSSHVTIDNAKLVLLDKTIDNLRMLEPYIHEPMPVVVVCPKITPSINDIVLSNFHQSNHNIRIFEYPLFSEYRKTLYDDFKSVANEMDCDNMNIILSSNGLFLVNAQGSKHKDMLKEQLDKEEDPELRNQLENRIANFERNEVQVFISANSDGELKEIKDKIDDAVKAVEAARSKGIVVGGLSILENLEEAPVWLKEAYKEFKEILGVNVPAYIIEPFLLQEMVVKTAISTALQIHRSKYVIV